MIFNLLRERWQAKLVMVAANWLLAAAALLVLDAPIVAAVLGVFGLGWLVGVARNLSGRSLRCRIGLHRAPAGVPGGIEETSTCRRCPRPYCAHSAPIGGLMWGKSHWW